MNILLDHIGFELKGGKQALAACTVSETLSPVAAFFLIRDGRAVYKGHPGKPVIVQGWQGRCFYQLDFSEVEQAGDYHIRLVDENLLFESPVFTIAEKLFVDRCISDILFYFKSQRCTWKWDEADHNAPFFGDRSDRVDVSGGWYDASGDYSKYLSHLSYANYMNPQQTPLVVWSLLFLKDELSADSSYSGSLLEERALEEGLFGADFLVRMQDEDGYFYITLFDGWSKDTERRKIASFRGIEGILTDNYQAGMRQGAGMAIAALAKASRFSVSGQHSSQEYLSAAVKGWDHLSVNNGKYLDNGRENIIDCYCALLAAVELYKSTGEDRFLDAARDRAGQLERLYNKDLGCWVVEEGNDRPFFHASDAGLPILSLIEYCGIEEKDFDGKSAAEELVRTAVKDLVELAGSPMDNPFMLARQWVKPLNADIRTSFFMPHENETGYWWQGENARLASISCVVRRSTSFFGAESKSFLSNLEDFADAQMHWILGRNPYDMCMLQGHGRNNPCYEENSINAPGGICNGITAGYEDENDIDFLPAAIEGRGNHRWRWSEQWIPHASWFLLSLSADFTKRKKKL
ncbi:MAG: glycoside hydrolase family 9 protein [Spirochaetales bacterium]|nr:glycoside hydrolase family 9 protein [Spirochaetales bacterium]